jgi:hypothetical protein
MIFPRMLWRLSKINPRQVFSPGIFSSGINLNRSDWEVQHLQMYSYGVRPFRVCTQRYDTFENRLKTRVGIRVS